MQIANPDLAAAPIPGSDDSPPVRFWVVAGVASLGGLLFGYDTGIIAGALLSIRDQFALTPAMEGIVAAAALIGAIPGVIAGGQLADRLGRRSLIFLCALAFIAASLLCGLAPNLSSLIAGRVFVGAAVGIASMVTPIYLAEISPPAQRGTIVSFNSLCIVGGMFGSYLLSWWMIDWTDSWRWMLGFGVLPGLLLAACIGLLPPSPRWLAAQGRFEEAREVLAHMRPDDAVDAELRLLKRDALRQAKQDAPTWATLLQPRYRRVVIVGVMLALFQQGSGINAVLYFAPRIFEQAGADTPALAILATAGVGFVNLLFTFVAMRLIDRAGRRALLLWGTGGICTLLLALGTGALVQVDSLLFAGACLGGFIAFFAVSLGSVYYVLVSEIFPLAIRGRAMSVAAATVWISNLVVTIVFPPLNAVLGNGGCFLIFAGVSALAFLFTLRMVPETRGRSLEEIERLFGRDDVRGPLPGERSAHAVDLRPARSPA